MKYKVKQVGVLFATLSIPVLMFGQTPTKNLALKDAIELGIEHSKDLKISAAQIEAATSVTQQRKDDKLPDFSVSGAYLYLAKPNIDLMIGQDSKSDDGSTDDGSGTEFPNVHQAVYGTLSASLPLFSGGKISNGIQSAKYLAKAAQLDAKNQQEAVVQNIINAYYNLYKADATLRLVRENLATAQQRAQDFSNLEANGIIPRNDLMKAELQQGNMELAVLDAENNRKISNFNFNLMLGLDDSLKIVIDSTEVPKAMPVESLGTLIDMAHSSRFDYLAVLEREKSAQFDTKVIEGNKLPSLALTGSYMAADVPKALTAYNVANVGVGLSYDIGSLYKNNAKVRESKAKEQILKVREEQMEDRIQTEIYQAYNNYSHELKKIDVLKNSIAQAQENYRITKNKYDNSLATATDLFDADVALLQAKINFENTRADAAISYTKIYETVGILNKRVRKNQQP